MGDGIADEIVQNPITLEEDFTQVPLPKLDVLWVIDPPDRLGDMKDKLQALASNTLDLLGDAGVDYRVGVTTTNVENGSPGRLSECVGVAKHIRSDEGTLSTRQEALRCIIDTPLRAGQASAGLEAATEAISRNLSALFIRPDARLVVVVVSARDDESKAPNERLLAPRTHGRGGR